jgi:DNA-binding IclR family transcriptional regulator
MAREELVPDYVAVAAVFYDSEGDTEGALCVGGPESRFTPKRVRYLGQRVKAAAEELSDRRRRSC